MGKVAIVGVEGSGKTVLMGALCECYKQGTEDAPYLMPENQAAFMFMERIPHKLRVEREWPEATSVSSLKAMRWTLRLGAEVLEEIEMLDYPGELYRLAFGERTKEEADAHRNELNEFLEHLTSAETLIVLLNLGDIQGLGTNARNAETVWITRGIFDFAKKLTGLKHQALVFTQADRFATMLKVAGGAAGVYAKHLPMLKTLYSDLKVIAVSAVSGVDAEGRPRQDYSVDGCLEVMREILWKVEAETQKGLALCCTYAARINAFSEGNEEMFIELLDEYYRAAKKLKECSKAVMPFYRTVVNAHLNRWNEVYLPLYSCVSYCAKRLTKERKTTAEAWEDIASLVDGGDRIIIAFRHFYTEKLKQAKEVQKSNQAAALIIFGVLGLVVLCLCCIAFVGGFR